MIPFEIYEQFNDSSQYYDFGKDFSAFSRELHSSVESIKLKYENILNKNLKNKKIRARASRGYKQFEKDYDIEVTSVSINDYYDNYVVIARGSDGKDYFLKNGFKIQIIGNFSPTSTSIQEPISAPQPNNKKSSPIMEYTKSYSKDLVFKYVQPWISELIPSKQAINYIKNAVSSIQNKKHIIVFSLSVPIKDNPGLTTDLITTILNRASSDEISFKLLKFDVKKENYIIIIKIAKNII
jgi:hypothetical protein